MPSVTISSKKLRSHEVSTNATVKKDRTQDEYIEHQVPIPDSFYV